MHIDSVFPPSSTGYSKPQSDVHGPFNLLRKSRNLRRTACTLPRSLPLPSIGKYLILWPSGISILSRFLKTGSI